MTAGADLVFVYQEANGTYVSGGVLDTMWPLSMALMALAAWQTAPPEAALGRATATYRAARALRLARLRASDQRRVAAAHTARPGLAAGALFAAGVRAGLTYIENGRILQAQTKDAITDALTQLGNRRRLMHDLERAVRSSRTAGTPTLAFFDLDGFKRYNDTFGHGAGDALLASLGGALAAAVADRGEAYRLGGDEFCVLLEGSVPRGDAAGRKGGGGAHEAGHGFTVTASCGVVVIPEDAATVDDRARASPTSGCTRRRGGAATRAHSQTQRVLMQLLTEREPNLHSHVHDVGELAVAVGRSLRARLRRARRAASRGRAARHRQARDPRRDPPQARAVDRRRVAFMRQHTVIGERILNVAPALRPVARLVRSSHERWDGSGYPDGLAGEGSRSGPRIVGVCDAFDAMTSDRPYQAARPPGTRSRSCGRTPGPSSIPTWSRHSVVISKRRPPARTNCRDGTGSTEPGGLPPVPSVSSSRAGPSAEVVPASTIFATAVTGRARESGPY